ncbi:MAG: (2Fe-2S) ferredoxin domain-containing protein [Flavobacteriaceae bacterium]|nr:(2Fe-2S) ferredoxin domain-containing protein [Flavobacteriaceae bacterium]
MKFEDRNIKSQLFICCNKRLDGASCASLDAEVLVNDLKNRLKKAGLWKKHKVTKTSCLGPCKDGISAIIYPQNQLLTQVKLADEDELYQLIISS